MADPTLVNGQITDAITQTSVQVLGNAPAQAMANVYQVMSHTTGLAMENAVAAQQQLHTLNNAVTTQGVNSISTMSTAVIARSVQEILTGNSIAEMLADLKAVGVSLKTAPTRSVPRRPTPPQPPVTGAGPSVVGVGQPDVPPYPIEQGEEPYGEGRGT